MISTPATQMTDSSDPYCCRSKIPMELQIYALGQQVLHRNPPQDLCASGRIAAKPTDIKCGSDWVMYDDRAIKMFTSKEQTAGVGLVCLRCWDMLANRMLNAIIMRKPCVNLDVGTKGLASVTRVCGLKAVQSKGRRLQGSPKSSIVNNKLLWR